MKLYLVAPIFAVALALSIWFSSKSRDLNAYRGVETLSREESKRWGSLILSKGTVGTPWYSVCWPKVLCAKVVRRGTHDRARAAYGQCHRVLDRCHFPHATDAQLEDPAVWKNRGTFPHTSPIKSLGLVALFCSHISEHDADLKKCVKDFAACNSARINHGKKPN